MNKNTNDYFAQTLTQVLEETGTNMGNALVLDHLAKNGTVTIEEAEFFHNLTTEVLTEAAEDFIPETIEVLTEDEMADQMAQAAPVADGGPEGEIFYDKAGNAYMFSGGQMIPVDGDDDGQIDPTDPTDPTMDAQQAGGDDMQQAPVMESELVQLENGNYLFEGEEFTQEELDAEVTALEESEQTPEEIQESEQTPVENIPEIIEESDNIVAKILANLR